MADEYLRQAIDYLIQEVMPLRDQADIELRQKLQLLSERLGNIETGVSDINSVLSDKKKLKELLAPVLGVDYFTDADIEHIVKLCTPLKGVHYFDGKPGKDGEDGEDGEKGDKPKHKWDGTKLYFEKPDGTWGRGVDLKGKQGMPGSSGSDGGRAIGTLIRVQLAGAEFPNTLGKLNFASGLDVTYDSFGKFNISNPYTTLSSLTDFPPIAGKANKKLSVKADESGVEWTVDDVNDLTDYDLQNQFKVGTASSYMEITTTGTDGPTLVEYWDTSLKGTKLYTKEITYTSGDPTKVVVTDLLSSKVMTTDIVYSSGEFQNKTITIT
jgi:hypothetical protein